MKMKNKKGGLLPEEATSIILTVIGLAIIVGVFFGLYKVFWASKETEQADAIIKQIGNRVNTIRTNITLTLTGPKGWILQYKDDVRRLCVACDSKLRGKECTGTTEKCVSIKEGLNVEIVGTVEIYLREIEIKKENEKIIIQEKSA